jgi:hypothetical protein
MIFAEVSRPSKSEELQDLYILLSYSYEIKNAPPKNSLSPLWDRVANAKLKP